MILFNVLIGIPEYPNGSIKKNEGTNFKFSTLIKFRKSFISSLNVPEKTSQFCLYLLSLDIFLINIFLHSSDSSMQNIENCFFGCVSFGYGFVWSNWAVFVHQTE